MASGQETASGVLDVIRHFSDRESFRCKSSLPQEPSRFF